MYQPREYRSSLILAAAMAGAGLTSGWVARAAAVEPGSAQHWDGREDTAFQRHVIDQPAPYRVSAHEQRDYWNGRPQHPG
jgi:hypothetical protein